MPAEIIGRNIESKLLKQCYDSNKAELVAVYGRRRVGKTFLVKTLFDGKFDFYISGIYNGSRSEELQHFNEMLSQYSGIPYPVSDNWTDAFKQLKHYLGSLKKDRILVFIDEMPWLDTPRSKFVKAFDLFWNEWASTCNNLCLIICGSATTWMNDNVISQKGGLHNRVTCKIKLSQFCLGETEKMLESKKIKWNRMQIAECWMILGGTPYYLDRLQRDMSLAQNIDFLFFRENAEFRSEYDTILKSLFKQSGIYKRIIELLAKKGKGLTRQEIVESLKLPEGGSLTSALENLCNCDFIRSYTSFGKKERQTMYQLSDMFTLFYIKFVKNSGGKDDMFWLHSIDSPSRRAWSGYAFEKLCLNHIPQIKESLGIRGVLSNVCSWYQKGDPAKGSKGAQIDLLIERRDQTINLCEAKYSSGPYTITKKYFEEMSERKEIFRVSSKTKYAILLTMITAGGLVDNEYSSMIPNHISLDDLFKIL